MAHFGTLCMGGRSLLHTTLFITNTISSASPVLSSLLISRHKKPVSPSSSTTSVSTPVCVLLSDITTCILSTMYLQNPVQMECVLFCTLHRILFQCGSWVPVIVCVAILCGCTYWLPSCCSVCSCWMYFWVFRLVELLLQSTFLSCGCYCRLFSIRP